MLCTVALIMMRFSFQGYPSVVPAPQRQIWCEDRHEKRQARHCDLSKRLGTKTTHHNLRGKGVIGESDGAAVVATLVAAISSALRCCRWCRCCARFPSHVVSVGVAAAVLLLEVTSVYVRAAGHQVRNVQVQ